MTENTVLPLINTAFEPGNARKAAESFADRDFREIAIAEFYYFTGQAQKCSDLGNLPVDDISLMQIQKASIPRDR